MPRNETSTQTGKTFIIIVTWKTGNTFEHDPIDSFREADEKFKKYIDHDAIASVELLEETRVRRSLGKLTRAEE